MIIIRNSILAVLCLGSIPAFGFGVTFLAVAFR